MSTIGSVIIIAGVVIYITVRYLTRERPGKKPAQFFKILGLTLVFYGCLKLIFGI
jgi:high-affinity Fe2+/Pb2+ permease